MSVICHSADSGSQHYSGQLVSGGERSKIKANRPMSTYLENVIVKVEGKSLSHVTIE